LSFFLFFIIIQNFELSLNDSTFFGNFPPYHEKVKTVSFLRILHFRFMEPETGDIMKEKEDRGETL